MAKTKIDIFLESYKLPSDEFKTFVEGTIKDVKTNLNVKLLDGRDYKSLSAEEQQSLNKEIDETTNKVKSAVEAEFTDKLEQAVVYEFMKTKSIKFDSDEDLLKVKDAFKDFNEYKNKPQWSASKTLQDFKTYQDLFNANEKFRAATGRDSAGDELFAKLKQIYSNDRGFKMYILDNWKTAEPVLNDKAFSNGWCVKYKGPWDNYKPPYYMITKYNKPFALVHNETCQIKDVADNPFPQARANEVADCYKFLRKNGYLPKFMTNFERDEHAFIQFEDDLDQNNVGKHISKSKNGDIIKHVKNATKDLKVTAVSNDASSVRHIQNPEEDLQLIAVKKNPYAILEIKNPSKAAIDLAIKLKPELEMMF